jgi:hypothetical protein
MSRFVLAGRLLVVPFVISLASCGDGLEKSPTGASAGGTVTATPTATPTATATPVTANPTPTPSGASSCTLPERTDCGNSGCCSEGGTALFNAAINDAQAELERTRPDIVSPNGDIKVEELEYTDALAAMLMKQNPGMCAVGGGRNGGSRSKDEVGIKVDNTVSQNVDVIIGSSHTHYIGGRYTCRPAAF